MKVFFSFYFTDDYPRALRVMDMWEQNEGVSSVGIISDKEIDQMGEAGLPAIYQWIEDKVSEADVVLVLIGSHTAGRHFVEYEIAQAYKHGKPIAGIYVHELPDEKGLSGEKGASPLLPVFPVYEWRGLKSFDLYTIVKDAAGKSLSRYLSLAPAWSEMIDATRLKFKDIRGDY